MIVNSVYIENMVYICIINKTEMNAINFTSGCIYQISSEYYNLVLENNGNVVYKATINKQDADKYADKYPNRITWQND
jgi:hypothetical protein